MSRQKLLGIVAVAGVAVATGFLVAGQVKAQLLTPSNQVARYQALVRSVQDLEATNTESRRQIASLRAQIDTLETEAAGRSAATRALRQPPFAARGEFTALLDAVAETLANRAQRVLSPGARVSNANPAGILAGVERVLAARERAQGNVNPQLITSELLRQLEALIA